MAIKTDKLDDTVLALLYLTLHDGDRAWKLLPGVCSAACTKKA